MKKILLVSMLVLGIFSCGESSKDSAQKKDEGVKKLVVGTNAQYRPFEYVDDNGELKGFDIDLMKAIGEKIGYEIEWKDMSFDTLVASLQTGKIDAVIAGMTPTEERKQAVDFSDIYYKSKEAFLKSKNNGEITSISNLEGKKILTQLGSIQEQRAKKIKNAEVITMEEIPAIIMALKNGKADAAIIEDVVAYEYIKQNPEVEIFEIEETEEGAAIALPKGSELIKNINEALKEIEKSGKYDELVKTYIKGE